MKSSNISLVSWFISHPNASKILLVLILLSGFVGVNSLRQEVFPAFAPLSIKVIIPARGVTAEDVESLIVKKIEESLEGLVGIQRIVASATNAGADISIELEPEADQQSLLTLVKSRIDSSSEFPAFADSPIYSLPERNSPVMFVNVVGDVPFMSLHSQALKLRTELSRLGGISYVAIENEPEISLYIDTYPEKLEQYELSLNDISQAISDHSVNMSAGTIQTTASNYQLRTNTKGSTTNDFKHIPILSASFGNSVYLKDVAEVSISPSDDYVVSQFNGKTSMMLSVYRNSAVTFSTAQENIQNFIEKKNNSLNPKINIVVWQDESREFTSRTDLLIKNGLSGFILILIIMGIFVSPTIAFWTAIGVPVSIIGAMGLLHYLQIDITLNAITLLGFLIVLGIIVDDALVVGESIDSEIKTNGYSKNSIITGTQKVAIPAVFGALTTIAAFFPLTQTEGEMGSRIGGIGIVVICCLVISIIESKLILPSHLRKPSNFFNWKIFNPIKNINKNATEWLKSISVTFYLPILNSVLNRPIMTVIFFIIVLMATIAIIPMGIMKVAVIPNIADFSLQSTIQFNPSLTPENKQKIGDQVARTLYEVDEEIKEKYEIDYSPIQHVSQQYSKSELVMDVELKNVFGAPYDAYEISALWREKLPKMTGISSIGVDAGANSSEKIAIQLNGPNINDVKQVSTLLQEYLHEQDNIVDIFDSEVSHTIEYQFVTTPFANSLGLSEQKIINQLRDAFYGSEAQRTTIGEREVRVMVRNHSENRTSLSAMENMLIPVDAGGSKDYVPLSALVATKSLLSTSEIKRIDKQRTITVYANVIPGNESPEAIADSVEDEILPEILARYPQVVYSIEGEAKEANKSLSSLISASALSIFILFSLIALPLGSFKYPLFILCLIPLGLIGAFWGHVLHGLTFSLVSIFGVIALGGILVNNGILLIDHFQNSTKKNIDIKNSIIDACLQRFRPILLTTITTFVGLMPLLWESDPEALWLIPIAISLGYGLIAATFITMLLLPSILLIFSKKNITYTNNNI